MGKPWSRGRASKRRRKRKCRGHPRLREASQDDSGKIELDVRTEEHLGAEVALVLSSHVRSDDSNDGVPEPVRGGGEGNATGTDGEREDLANDDPSTRTPG